MPGAGRLNRRVTFQAEVQTPDGGGGYVLAWSSFLTVWGGFQPERGREALAAGRLQSAASGVLTVRVSSDTETITTDHRVLIDGEPYQVRSIGQPDQSRKFYEMVVEKGVAT